MNRHQRRAQQSRNHSLANASDERRQTAEQTSEVIQTTQEHVDAAIRGIELAEWSLQGALNATHDANWKPLLRKRGDDLSRAVAVFRHIATGCRAKYYWIADKQLSRSLTGMLDGAESNIEARTNAIIAAIASAIDGNDDGAALEDILSVKTQ